MSKAEMKRFSSNAMYEHIPIEEERVGNGSACNYPGVYTQIDPFPFATVDNLRRQPGEGFEAAQGVGDAAYLRNKADTYAELFGRVGQRVFTIQMTIGPQESFATAKPRLIELGRVIAAKLR